MEDELRAADAKIEDLECDELGEFLTLVVATETDSERWVEDSKPKTAAHPCCGKSIVTSSRL